MIDWKAPAADFSPRNSQYYVAPKIGEALPILDTSYGAVFPARKERLYKVFEGVGILVFSELRTRKKRSLNVSIRVNNKSQFLS